MRRFAFLFVLPLFFSCASIDVDEMVTDETSFGAHHPGSVNLNVHGGSGGAWLYSGTMGADDFEEAIQRSIEGATLFQEVVPEDSATYLLEVKLTYAASHPGFTMSAWVTANWSLVDRASGDSLWATEVSQESKATVGDAFSGAKRQYMAIERATKAHIRDALTEIGALSLAGP